MDSRKYKLHRIFAILMLNLYIWPATATNIDCHGKSFHCVNSTHFMICVDLGGGISKTVNDFSIQCPPLTVCGVDNHLECVYQFTTSTQSTVNSRHETKELTTDSGVTTTSSIEITNTISSTNATSVIGLFKENHIDVTTNTNYVPDTQTYKNEDSVIPKLLSNRNLSINNGDLNITESTTQSYLMDFLSPKTPENIGQNHNNSFNRVTLSADNKILQNNPIFRPLQTTTMRSFEADTISDNKNTTNSSNRPVSINNASLNSVRYTIPNTTIETTTKDALSFLDQKGQKIENQKINSNIVTTSLLGNITTTQSTLYSNYTNIQEKHLENPSSRNDNLVTPPLLDQDGRKVYNDMLEYTTDSFLASVTTSKNKELLEENVDASKFNPLHKMEDLNSQRIESKNELTTKANAIGQITRMKLFNTISPFELNVSDTKESFTSTLESIATTSKYVTEIKESVEATTLPGIGFDVNKIFMTKGVFASTEYNPTTLQNQVFDNARPKSITNITNMTSYDDEFMSESYTTTPIVNEMSPDIITEPISTFSIANDDTFHPADFHLGETSTIITDYLHLDHTLSINESQYPPPVPELNVSTQNIDDKQLITSTSHEPFTLKVTVPGDNRKTTPGLTEYRKTLQTLNISDKQIEPKKNNMLANSTPLNEQFTLEATLSGDITKTTPGEMTQDTIKIMNTSSSYDHLTLEVSVPVGITQYLTTVQELNVSYQIMQDKQLNTSPSYDKLTSEVTVPGDVTLNTPRDVTQYPTTIQELNVSDRIIQEKQFNISPPFDLLISEVTIPVDVTVNRSVDIAQYPKTIQELNASNQIIQDKPLNIAPSYEELFSEVTIPGDVTLNKPGNFTQYPTTTQALNVADQIIQDKLLDTPPSDKQLNSEVTISGSDTINTPGDGTQNRTPIQKLNLSDQKIDDKRLNISPSYKQLALEGTLPGDITKNTPDNVIKYSRTVQELNVSDPNIPDSSVNIAAPSSNNHFTTMNLLPTYMQSNILEQAPHRKEVLKSTRTSYNNLHDNATKRSSIVQLNSAQPQYGSLDTKISVTNETTTTFFYENSTFLPVVTKTQKVEYDKQIENTKYSNNSDSRMTTPIYNEGSYMKIENTTMKVQLTPKDFLNGISEFGTSQLNTANGRTDLNLITITLSKGEQNTLITENPIIPKNSTLDLTRVTIDSSYVQDNLNNITLDISKNETLKPDDVPLSIYEKNITIQTQEVFNVTQEVFNLQNKNINSTEKSRREGYNVMKTNLVTNKYLTTENAQEMTSNMTNNTFKDVSVGEKIQYWNVTHIDEAAPKLTDAVINNESGHNLTIANATNVENGTSHEKLYENYFSSNETSSNISIYNNKVKIYSPLIHILNSIKTDSTSGRTSEPKSMFTEIREEPNSKTLTDNNTLHTNTPRISIGNLESVTTEPYQPKVFKDLEKSKVPLQKEDLDINKTYGSNYKDAPDSSVNIVTLSNYDSTTINLLSTLMQPTALEQESHAKTESTTLSCNKSHENTTEKSPKIQLNTTQSKHNFSDVETKGTIKKDENLLMTPKVFSNRVFATPNLVKIMTIHNTNVRLKPFKRSTNIATFTCNFGSRGRFADKNNCRKYYICIGISQPILGDCPINTVFSEIKKQCTKNLSHCMRNNQFRCTQNGRFSDLLRSNIYYICVNRKNGYLRFQFQCHKGFHLNKTSVRCVEDIKYQSLITSISINSNSNKGSDQSTVERKSIQKKQTKADANYICEKEGKFPDAADCRRYYVCTKNSKLVFRRRTKKCDSDEVFHREKKKCVDSESYECN